jgi:hypothetical protein
MSIARSTSLLVLLVFTSACTAETDDTDVAAVEEALGHFGPGGDPLIHQDHPLGQWLYQQIAKGWLKWMMGQPFSTGPVADTTGDACGLDQHGPLFYLAGTTGGPVERDCDIPRHKALVVPLMNQWIIATDEDITDFGGIDPLIEAVEEYYVGLRGRTCELMLTLDGEPILADTAERDAELWTQVSSDPFPIFLDDDNYFGDLLPGGWYPAAFTAGHYALLKPLSRGHHTLEFGGVRCNGTEVSFETSAVYHLHVH